MLVIAVDLIYASAGVYDDSPAYQYLLGSIIRHDIS